MGHSAHRISRFAIGAVALFLIGAAILGVSGEQAGEAMMVDQPEAIRKIEETTGLRLPERTVVIGLDEGGAIDFYLSAKLAMPARALAEWLIVLRIAPDAFSEDSRYLLGTSEGWWDPEVPMQLPTAQTELAPGRILNIGIDRSDPEQPIIYLFWHET